MAARLKERYEKDVRPQLVQRFSYSSVMQAPRIEKITVNMGVGEAKTNTAQVRVPIDCAASCEASP